MPLDERDKDGKERGGVSLMSGIDKLCNRCENCAFREGKVAVTTDTQTRTDREKDALHADGRTTVGARVGERMDRVCLLYTKCDSQRNFRIGPSDTVLKQMERMAHKTSRDQKYILNQFSFSILANFQVNESESYFFCDSGNGDSRHWHPIDPAEFASHHKNAFVPSLSFLLCVHLSPLSSRCVDPKVQNRP